MKNPKVCFLTYRNIFDTPCLSKYEELLNGNFDIIYFDRYNVDESCNAKNMYRFKWYLDSKKSGRLKKYIGYIKFGRYAKNIIRKNKYSKIIVLPTQTAIAFSRFLIKEYKNQYVIDIRDYAGENKSAVKKIVNKLISNCGITSITSPAYRSFLPEHKYVISHNIQPIDEKIVEDYKSKELKKSGPITISFIGTIRFIDQLKKMIDVFANDDRFELCFAGSGSELLKEYCENNHVTNVKLIPRFERPELGKLYLDTDIAMNIYGNNDPYLDYALSNKLYSAAIMGMPILVSPKTYMEEIVTKYGFGLAVDLDDKSSPDKVFDYYNELDINKLRDGCQSFMDTVEKDEDEYQKVLNDFFKYDINED